MDNIQEVWKAVVGYEGEFEVSNHGNCRSLDRLVRCRAGALRVTRGKTLKPMIRGSYPSISLRYTIHRSVHGLVCAAFIGPRPTGMQVNHIDGNKLNAMLSNLEYVTPIENVRHACRTGLTDHRGEKNSGSKLRSNDVLQIRSMFASGMVSKQEIAKHFSIHETHVSAILRRVAWGHL